MHPWACSTLNVFPRCYLTFRPVIVMELVIYAGTPPLDWWLYVEHVCVCVSIQQFSMWKWTRKEFTCENGKPPENISFVL